MVSINCLDIGTEIGNLNEAHVSPAMSMTFPRSYPPPQDIHAAFREHNEVQMRRGRKYAEMASLTTGWYNSHEFIITYSATAHLVGHPLSESFYAKIMTIHRVSGHFRRRRQTILAASGWLAAFLTNLTTIGKFVEGISNTIFVIPSWLSLVPRPHTG
jgi:hypothetical protein